MLRTRKDYMRDISDGREIWIGDRKINSVIRDKALSRGAEAFANLYDISSTCENEHIFYRTDEKQDLVFRAFEPCSSREDLVAKHSLHATWAEASFGFLGRTPDYMAAGLSGWITNLNVFRGAAFDGSGNVSSLYKEAREKNLFLSFALTNFKKNQRGRGVQAGVKVTGENDAGIFVSGIKGIGTAVIYADEIIVGSIEPLAPDESEYGLTFYLKPSTPGLKFISRKSYSEGIHSIDAPISSEFDENDSLLVMKDVFVPWERVLTYRDVSTTFAVWWNSQAYVCMAHQAAIRFYKKMEFLAGLAYLIAQANGLLAIPEVRQTLGRLVGYAEVAKAIACGAESETTHFKDQESRIFPARYSTYAQRIFAAEVYPKMLHEIRMLCGGSLVALPKSIRDFGHPEIKESLLSIWETGIAEGVDKAKLFKLAWDATSSEFAMRHAHYEQFYQGPPFVYFQQMADSEILGKLGKFAERAIKRG